MLGNVVQLGAQNSHQLFSALKETVAEDREGRDGITQEMTLVRNIGSGGRLPGSPLGSAPCQLRPQV